MGFSPLAIAMELFGKEQHLTLSNQANHRPLLKKPLKQILRLLSRYE